MKKEHCDSKFPETDNFKTIKTAFCIRASQFIEMSTLSPFRHSSTKIIGETYM